MAPAPPHSTNWQQDHPPYRVIALPNNLPGPPGYHFIAPQDAAAAALRARAGLEPIAYTSPGWGPGPTLRPPVGGGGRPVVVSTPPSVPAPTAHARPTRDIVRRRRPAREPRAPREPRPPRPRRPPRAKRPPRAPRPPRTARPPRPPRKPRKPRPPRKPRAPRKSKTKGDDFDYYCGYNIATGQVAQHGSPTKVKRGGPEPASAPGSGQIQVDGGFVCGSQGCKGPWSPILESLFDLLPDGWRPLINAAEVERAKDRIARRRKHLERIPSRRGGRVPGPQMITGSYCCVCGETGGCYTTGGDCRLLPVLQRSKGQC